MSITTLLFLGFFAAVAVLCYALPRVARPYFLLIASYVFFAWLPADRPLLPVLVIVTLVTWGCGFGIGRSKQPAVRVGLLLAALFTCLGLLIYYKYWDMLLGLFGAHRSLAAIAAPMGISYFALAALSYPLDVFKNRCKVEKNLLHYAMFVSFFPTLVTGPIERYPHMRHEIEKARRFSYDRCAGGAFRMLWGYYKKMVLADNLNLYISAVYATPQDMAGPHLVAAALLFSVRLYMDFSGCCDIVLGAARILGYDLLENFDRPFEATSYAELWRRWHISLTTWFRDYVYFPLGGSRCALWRQLLNTMVVFTVSGLWHGADVRYLVWGVCCGAILVLGILTAKPRALVAHYNPLYRLCWLRVSIQQCIVFLLFSFSFVFFASAAYDFDPLAVLAGMSSGWQGLGTDWWAIGELMIASGLEHGMVYAVPAGCAVVFLVEHYARNVARWIRRRNFVVRWVLYYAAAVCILFFGAFGQSAFIYQVY